MCICLYTHIHTSSHLPVMNLNSETLPHLGSTELLISVSQGSTANAMAGPSEGTMKRRVAQQAESGPDKAKRTVTGLWSNIGA